MGLQKWNGRFAKKPVDHGAETPGRHTSECRAQCRERAGLGVRTLGGLWFLNPLS